MSKGKPQVCSALQWLQQHDSKLYDAAVQLCVDKVLWSKSVTLVYPGKELRERIQAGAESGDGAATDEAERLLRAHIVFGTLDGPEDWAGEHGTAAGFKVVGKPTAKGAQVGSAELARHATNARTAAQFRVWDVVKGAMPTEGEPWDRRAGKRGGAGGPAAPAGLRRAHADLTAASFRAALQCGQCSAVYLRASYGLMLHLKRLGGEHWQRAVMCADADPMITYYTLLEPFRTAGHLLPDAVLFGPGGWNGFDPMPASVDDWLAAVDPAGLTCAAVADRPGLISRIDAFRQKLTGSRSDVVRRILEQYGGLAQENALLGVQGVLPGGSGAGRALQDERRFSMSLLLLELYAARGGEAPAVFDALLSCVSDAYPGNSLDELQLLSPSTTLADQGRTGALSMFVASTDLFYTPEVGTRMGTELPEGWSRTPVTDPEDSRVWNRNGAGRDAAGLVHSRNAALAAAWRQHGGQ